MYYFVFWIHYKTDVIMNDGTLLKVYVWLPSDTINKKFPTLLVRTPYDTLGFLDSLGIAFIVNNNFAYVVNTLRGYWGSGGIKSPFLNDGWGPNQDGKEIATWITNQHWSNDTICTFGGSALGFTQYFLAGTGFNLTCATPSISGFSLYHEVFYNGVFRKFIVENWLNLVSATMWLDTIEKYAIYSENTPWAWINGYSRLSYFNVPMLHITGWFDAFTEGAINAFNYIRKYGNYRAKNNQYILIGPWSHKLNRDTVGDFIFPENSKVDLPLLHFYWFLYWTRKVGDWSNVKRVKFYLMGENKWIEADSFPPSKTIYQNWFLVKDSLKLFLPNYLKDSFYYYYDPNNPVPTIGGFDFFGIFNVDSILFGPRDLSPLHNRNDVIIYTSSILTHPLVVVGQPFLNIYASSDKLDTDFIVMLADVFPDGKSVLITEGVLRARNRNGVDREDLLNPNQIYQFTIKLRNTAYVFKENHRIRLYITSSKFPSYEPNPNNGGPFRRNDPNKLIALNKVFTGQIYPSFISLPVNDMLVFPEISEKEKIDCLFKNGSFLCGGKLLDYVYDMNGRKILNRNLKKGIYFIKLGKKFAKLMVMF
ncbi:MAG: CocE/NonD family hydrolase [candidate division WOR-3 bacterium]|nr:CocE/NonD family hydrolase [candidate division WOR-3 bacterium]MCX7947423.1 CocE/NonD family hydrolase [candidate division WOR-3 bacterium]MDW8151179.1 CocE/NonD family hydrolase [candidate division WOR-3 bacterium]